MTTYMTTTEVAQYCGVSFRTVIRWVQRGLLQAHRLPGRGDHRISKEDFLQFLNEQKIDALRLNLDAEQFKRPEQVNSKGRKKSILIVDDEVDLCMALAEIIANLGHRVLIANNGLKAGLILGTEKVDLITLDLNMPGLNGDDVLKHIRMKRGEEDLKLLIISASSPDKLQSYLAKGANDVLCKPFSQDELRDKITQLIGAEKEDSNGKCQASLHRSAA